MNPAMAQGTRSPWKKKWLEMSSMKKTLRKQFNYNNIKNALFFWIIPEVKIILIWTKGIKRNFPHKQIFITHNKNLQIICNNT